MEGRAMSELQEIVGAIRHVEHTMERRAARVEGTFLTLWGLGAAAMFLFYRAAHADPAAYDGPLAPLVDWAWVAPFVVCYLLTLFLGARSAPIMPQGPRVWRDPFAMVAFGGTAVFVLGGRALGHPEWSTAALVAFGGAMLVWRTRRWGGLAARAGVVLALAAAPLALAIALYAHTTHVSHALAAAYWGLAWPIAGAVVYSRGG